MSRVLIAPKGSSPKTKPLPSPHYKMFIWDLGTDTKEPHEATIRTIAILEYTSPGTKITHFSTAVRPPDVKTKKPTPTFPDAWLDFKKFIHDHDEGKPPLFVSHNAGFDVTVLLGELRRHRIKVPSSWRFACSLLLARSIYPFTHHNSQLALAANLGIRVNRPHDTSEDVIVLRRILCKLDDKAVKDDKPVNRVVPALCLHARNPSFFDRTPQFAAPGALPAKFFITITGTRYHREDCRTLSRSKIPRKTIPQGFEPCGICRPNLNDDMRTSRAYSGNSHGTGVTPGHRADASKTASRKKKQYFVTNSGGKYHVESCKWLGKSKIPVDSPPSDKIPCRTCIRDENPRTRSSPTEKSNAEPGTKSSSKEGPFYVTKTGEKYHVKGCRSLSQSCILKSERPAGYDPCGRCLPNIAYNGTPKLRTMKKH